jgi:hypothetical protein
MDFKAQMDDLHALAEAAGVDLRPVNELPDDPRMRIAALATLLRVDPILALRGEAPVDELVSGARERERMFEEYRGEEQERLGELGIEIQKGG